MEVGLNLFSIKTLISTEKDFIQTALKLKEMGYSYMQFSGVPYDPKLIKKVIEESGLPIVLTHIPMNLLLDSPEKLVEEHLSFGCKNIGLGAVTQDATKTPDLWRKKIEELSLVAERIAKAGGKFFYHHHSFEFIKWEDGKTVLDYMIENAPNISFTLDSYWLQHGGQNPIDFADKVKGRMECVHLKDYMMEIDKENIFQSKPKFAPVGAGLIDFNKLIPKWKEFGAKYFIVEQDDACQYPDPLEQVKISIENLMKI